MQQQGPMHSLQGLGREENAPIINARSLPSRSRPAQLLKQTPPPNSQPVDGRKSASCASS